MNIPREELGALIRILQREHFPYHEDGRRALAAYQKLTAYYEKDFCVTPARDTDIGADIKGGGAC